MRRILENKRLKTIISCCGCTRYDRKNSTNDVVSIDYNIQYNLPLLPGEFGAITVEYYFSENTLKDLMATLMLKKEDNEWTDSKRLEVSFHRSCSLLSVAQLVNLLRVCSERNIIIRGLNNPSRLNWENALNISRNLKQDTTTLKYSRDLSGRPHLMSIYLSEHRLKEFAKKVYKRPSIFSEIQTSNKKVRWLFDKQTRNRNKSKHRDDQNTGRPRAMSQDGGTEDFVKRVHIDRKYQALCGNKATVAFNFHDDPFQVARKWVNENARLNLKDDDVQKKEIMNQIASQVIPIKPDKDKVGYVLRKIKILFKIRRMKMKEQSAKISAGSIIGEIFQIANDYNPHKMRYGELMSELRRDGTMRKLSEKEIERRAEWKKQKKCCGKDKDEEFYSDYEDEENELLNIVKYLSDIGDVNLIFDEKTQRGYVYDNIPIYEQCIKLDFDINATDIATGESLIFTLIRKNDEENLRKLLFEYQIEKKIRIDVDIHNLKGKSPLFYALRAYMNNQENKLYLLLLQSDADPNFPCVKRAQITTSPLNYLLYEVHKHSDLHSSENGFYWTMINDLIYYGASLLIHEGLTMSTLMIPDQILNEFDFDEWNEHYLKKIKAICQKLKLPFNSIEDEHGNNPIHLLLNKYYESSVRQNEARLIRQKRRTSQLIPDTKPKNSAQIKKSVKYLYDLFGFDMSDSIAGFLKSDKIAQFFGSDTIIEDAQKYLDNLDDIDDEKGDFMVSNHKISANKEAIFKIGKELMSINWKWMQSTNSDDNLAITSVLSEDEIPINLIKTVYETLDTEYKKKSFVDAIKSNEFAMSIMSIYIISSITKVSKSKHNFTIMNANALKRNVHWSKSVDVSHLYDQMIADEKMKTQEFVSSTVEVIKRDKTEINVGYIQDYVQTHQNVNKFEIFYSAIVESLSVADLVTDLFVLAQLINAEQQWWTSFMLLFLLAPYLVSFCALASIFQSREKDIANVLCLVLITPLSILLLITVDLTFMIFVIFQLIGLIFCFWNKRFLQFIDQDDIFQFFGISHMEVKGYRRLRTLSQLTFETVPQTILQLRMISQLNNAASDDEHFESLADELDVSEASIVISLVIALIHFAFEVVILSIESKAVKLSWFKYGIECLNSRLNWVPLLNKMIESDAKQIKKESDRENVIDWDNLQHSLCGQPYHLAFEFCEGSFRRLYTHITRIQKFTDNSMIETRSLQCLLPNVHSLDITFIKLGINCCKFVSLRELSRIYRNSDNRVILDGSEIDWKRKVNEQRNLTNIDLESNMLMLTQTAERMQPENDDKFDFDEGVFSDFMQHGEVLALYAIWNGIQEAERQKIDIFALKKQSLIRDLTDVYTMKRFFQHRYLFGNSCNECHIIYDRIVNYYDVMLRLRKRNKSEWSDAFIEYENMVLLMLFFTRSSIFNHRCPQCNISWKEYIIQSLQTEHRSIDPYEIDICEQLPKFIKINFENGEEQKHDDNDKESSVNIPFILAECSEILCDVIGQQIMQNNTKANEPLFNKLDQTALDEMQWSFVDNDGIWRKYVNELQHSINEQFHPKYKKWKKLKKECDEEQKEMLFEDNIISINLNKGNFFEREENLGKYQIIINYHHVPPKYTQISTHSHSERMVKQTRVNSVLEIYESDLDGLTQSDLNQNCIDILSSIIEYDYDAQQSFRIVNHHYNLQLATNIAIVGDPNALSPQTSDATNFTERSIDSNDVDFFESGMNYNGMSETDLGSRTPEPVSRQPSALWRTARMTQTNFGLHNENAESYFVDFIDLAKRLKMRHGWDKVLLAVQRFYKKDTIKIQSTEPYSSSICGRFEEKALGIMNLSASIIVNSKRMKENLQRMITKTRTNDFDDALPRTNTQFAMAYSEVVTPLPMSSSDLMIDPSLDSVECELWLKIPINVERKQIESWNDVLLKTVLIDLSQNSGEDETDEYFIKIYRDEINVNLEENYVGLGSWNPSLLDSDTLEFEVKVKEDVGDDEDGYSYDAFIESAEVTMICEELEDKRVIDQTVTKYLNQHQSVVWKWFDEQTNEYQRFDLESEISLTNNQIERDYQQLTKVTKDQQKTLIIPITDGIFYNQPKNKNKYQIRIIRQSIPYLYYQVNIETGKTKLVKREIVDSSKQRPQIDLKTKGPKTPKPLKIKEPGIKSIVEEESGAQRDSESLMMKILYK